MYHHTLLTAIISRHRLADLGREQANALSSCVDLSPSRRHARSAARELTKRGGMGWDAEAEYHTAYRTFDWLSGRKNIPVSVVITKERPLSLALQRTKPRIVPSFVPPVINSTPTVWLLDPDHK